MHIHSRPQRTPFRQNQIICVCVCVCGCIALNRLCIFMFLHKEIERLKINMYSRLRHFRLASASDRSSSSFIIIFFYFIVIFFIFMVIKIINVIWQFETRWNQCVPNRRFRDICWIIKNRDHVQFKNIAYFNKLGSER